MNLPLSVALGMVHKAVNEVGAQADVGGQRVSKDVGPLFYVLPYFGLEGGALGVGDHRETDFPMPLLQPRHYSLAHGAAPLALAPPRVHVPSTPADERLSDFNSAG